MGVEHPDATLGVDGLVLLLDRCSAWTTSGTGSLRDDWLVELVLLSDLATYRDELPYDVPLPLLELLLLLYARLVSCRRAG